jgi:hypothetical protein
MITPPAPPTPHAFLALWNSIASSAAAPEYETWHTFEHVPERVGLPGFIEARRYRAQPAPGQHDAAPRYFTLYWLSSLDALQTPQYHDVFTHPTPWSGRMRRQLREFMRQPCTLAATAGQSSAFHLATLHWQIDDLASFSLHATRRLEHYVTQADLVGAHWGLVSHDASFPIANSITENPCTPSEKPIDLLSLEDMVPAALALCAAKLSSDLSSAGTLLSSPVFFELLCQTRHSDLTQASTGRPAPRLDLMQHYPEGDIK